MNKICAHTILRYEPFIVYAVESVIDYVDKFLLYDTGSRNAPFKDYSIEDCEMLANKYPDKIVFKEIPIHDETPWCTDKYNQFRQYMNGKKCKGEVRRQQILDTDASKYRWSFIVDSDEFYTDRMMESIRDDITQKDWGSIQNIRVPIRWYYDMEHYFEGYGANTSTGRLLLTEKTEVLVKSPGELHLSKDTMRPFSYADNNMMIASSLDHMFHFETYLKPWRRDIPSDVLQPRRRDLPKVMKLYPEYIERYETELRDERVEYYRDKQKQLFG